MAELKPLGSEKLNSDDKLKRILELTYYNNNNKTTSSKAELVKESTTGGVFGIVKEKDAYYVKRGLNESSLDYIGGMFMKNKNRFSSYAEAYKRLEYIKGQEELQEATKYVLKQPSQAAPAPAQAEAPAAEPSMDAPATAPADAPMPTDSAAPTDAPSPEMGGDEASPEMSGDEGSGKRSDYMAEVQKYAGKLGQELRDLHDRMESDDIKYVLNMVISAVDLDKLSDEDIEEIGKKFERDEEKGNDSSSDDNTSSEPSADTDLGEEAMNKLDEFINAPHIGSELGETSLDSYMSTENVDEEKEIDLDEIKNNISQAVSETLSKYFKH
jgi:hypothetical protein